MMEERAMIGGTGGTSLVGWGNSQKKWKMKSERGDSGWGRPVRTVTQQRAAYPPRL
ncbi:unnamed protein product, partial [Wuchereria bancrofti]